jgi:hypothetical protein
MILAVVVSFGCTLKQESNLDKQSIPATILALTYTRDEISTVIEPTGNPILRTDQEKFIISKGKESVPHLIEAIATQANPLVLGGAAFCLGIIGDRTGFSTARMARQKLIAHDSNTRESIFAEKRLDEYLLTETKFTRQL